MGEGFPPLFLHLSYFWSGRDERVRRTRGPAAIVFSVFGCQVFGQSSSFQAPHFSPCILTLVPGQQRYGEELGWKPAVVSCSKTISGRHRRDVSKGRKITTDRATNVERLGWVECCLQHGIVSERIYRVSVVACLAITITLQRQLLFLPIRTLPC